MTPIATPSPAGTEIRHLELVDPEVLGLDAERLAHVDRIIRRHIEEERYPGCQLAIGRDDRLAWFKTYGDVETKPARIAAEDSTLWLLYSCTKVITAAAVWALVEDGALAFDDRVADHIPGFGANAKGDITVAQVLTHQAGFPNATVTRQAWQDHELLRREVCDFRLEWTPGSRVHYHGLSGPWVLGVLIEELTSRDFRDVIRDRIIAPLGIADELFVGVLEHDQARIAEVHNADVVDEIAAQQGGAIADALVEYRATRGTSEWYEAGIPGGGGCSTARALATFYLMLAQRGRLGSQQLFSQRMVDYVSRNHTGNRRDELLKRRMYRGLGPYQRGPGLSTRGFGALAPAETFGHGGGASAFGWADPTSGVSFAFVSNYYVAAEFHDNRLEKLSNVVHTAIRN